MTSWTTGTGERMDENETLIGKNIERIEYPGGIVTIIDEDETFFYTDNNQSIDKESFSKYWEICEK